MGDVISSHLDEGKREIITARTGEVMGQFDALYEQQYGVALFNKVRFDVEGGGGPQPQLLHRKVPLENRCIFSGALFQYLEENRKWRNRFLFIPDSYSINYYDSKASHDRGLQPKGTLSCAGYKVLTSMEQYLELVANSLPGVKAKVGSAPFLKVATQFPLILWHPYGRHLYFCVGTEKERDKWLAVFQDCVRHANDGLSEESRVQTPAFTDSVRLFRQAKGQYGTWDMMCGGHPQILSNLVMEILLPEIRDLISPRLKGKMHERQRNWMLISDAVYSLVQRQCEAQFRALEQRCEAGRPLLEASIRTDMDQIITSKEHVTNKIRGVVLSKADKLLKVSIQPYISSILEALMEPTSRGFSEVRDVFFGELVDMSKNAVNEGTKETVAEHMDKISMLAFHPVKMQSCYEKVEGLSLDGLQQRFDVSSPSVFVQRAQILMREQMDDAVYTFEQILHQSLEAQGTEGLCKTIQRCQDRVIKKFDYDSSTVRKRFFREALLQIFIPYMLKQLTPSCSSDLPRFQELIFEDFTRFILVDSIFEEVVLHSVMKDIMTAVKDAAVQRRHNLYRDSIVLTSSDPNLHLLGENPSIDWAEEYGAHEEERDGEGEGEEGGADAADDGTEAKKKRGRMKQVVSMIQMEGSPTLANASCLDAPGVDGIPEEEEEDEEEEGDDEEQKEEVVDEEKDKEGGVPAGSPNSGCNGIAGGPADPGAPPAAPTDGGPSEETGSEEVVQKEAPPAAGGEEQPSAPPAQSGAAGGPAAKVEEEEKAEVAPAAADNAAQEPADVEIVTETVVTAPAAADNAAQEPADVEIVTETVVTAPAAADNAAQEPADVEIVTETVETAPAAAADNAAQEPADVEIVTETVVTAPAAAADNAAQEPADVEIVTETVETAPVPKAPQESPEEPPPPPPPPAPVTAAPVCVQDTPPSSPKPTPPEAAPPSTDREPATTASLPAPPAADGKEAAEDTVAPPPEQPDATTTTAAAAAAAASPAPPPPADCEEEKTAPPPEQPDTTTTTTTTAAASPAPPPPADCEEEKTAPPPEQPDTTTTTTTTAAAAPAQPPLPTSEEEKGAAPESPRQQPELEPTRPSDSQSAEEDSSGPCSQ
ncbi:unnamed protein product [Arctogadus glacialis]